MNIHLGEQATGTWRELTAAEKSELGSLLTIHWNRSQPSSASLQRMQSFLEEKETKKDRSSRYEESGLSLLATGASISPVQRLLQRCCYFDTYE